MQQTLRESKFIKDGLYYSPIEIDSTLVIPNVTSETRGNINHITYKWCIEGRKLATLSIDAKTITSMDSPKYSLVIYYSDHKNTSALLKFMLMYCIDAYSYTLSIKDQYPVFAARMLKPYNYQTNALPKGCTDKCLQRQLSKKIKLNPGNIISMMYKPARNAFDIDGVKILRFDNHSDEVGTLLIESLLKEIDVCIFSDRVVSIIGSQSLGSVGYTRAVIELLHDEELIHLCRG